MFLHLKPISWNKLKTLFSIFYCFMTNTKQAKVGLFMTLHLLPNFTFSEKKVAKIRWVLKGRSTSSIKPELTSYTLHKTDAQSHSAHGPSPPSH